MNCYEKNGTVSLEVQELAADGTLTLSWNMGYYGDWLLRSMADLHSLMS